MSNEKPGPDKANKPSAAASAASIAPNDPNYPPYAVIFKGSDGPHAPATGPHTDHVNVDGVTVDAVITHETADKGPKLLITLTRKPD